MYQVGENQKYSECPQTEIEHLTVKSTPYTLGKLGIIGGYRRLEERR